MYFLEGLHEDLKEHVPTSTDSENISSDTTVRDEAAEDTQAKSKNQSIITELFQGWLETYLTCGNKECGKVIRTSYSITVVLLLIFSEIRCSKPAMLSCFCLFRFLMQMFINTETCTGANYMRYDCLAIIHN